MSEYTAEHLESEVLKLERARDRVVAHVETGRFRSAPERLAGELEERLADNHRAMKYHNAILDDYLRALLPTDLVLLGAPTGIGKTDLALNITTTNAFLGKRVHYFALEAEPREIERRTKFAMLSAKAYEAKHEQRSQLNYADWRLGRCEHICNEFNDAVDKAFAVLGPLFTFYRGNKFNARDLEREILEVHESTDLIVVDHLHYIDSDNENEARALGDTVKTIRDIALNVGKPVILVAHLRKKEQGSKRLVATIDDFHGSSNITKICTQAIVLDRCLVIEPSKWFLSPTFVSILKDRRSGPMPFAAVMNYDRRTKSYASSYTLGRLTKGGAEWEALSFNDIPEWAKHHKDLA